MKKNYSRNKLDLNKQTIVNLNSGEMRRIRGGSYPETVDIAQTSVPLPSCAPCPEDKNTVDTDPTLP